MKAILALVCLLVVLGSGTVIAAPLCLPGTMADFVALGSTGCQIGDKLFYDFEYTATGSGGAIAIPSEGVAVTPISTPFNPGLRFNSGWAAGPGQMLDSMINYSVVVLAGGAPIGDISATMSGYGYAPDGIVAVAETTTVGSLLLYDCALGVKSIDRLDLAPTLGPITVHKDISVNGNTGMAIVSGVSNQFSEVPEPATGAVIGAALFGLGVTARLRVKHRT